MDIQERKIHFAQEFLRLKNEELIQKFEMILRSEKQKSYERNLSPMSMDDFNKIIDSAEQDSQYGRTTPVSGLKNELDSWT